jgi:hypothetical protein
VQGQLTVTGRGVDARPADQTFGRFKLRVIHETLDVIMCICYRGSNQTATCVQGGPCAIKEACPYDTGSKICTVVSTESSS